MSRVLHDRLGGEASESLVEMLRQLAEDQEQRRAEQREHLLEVLDERFLRRLAETEERLHTEIGAVRADLGKEIADLGKEIADTRADLHQEIGAVRKEIADTRADLHREIGAVRKEITSQTKWILVVMVAATVLIPVWQRVMSALIPG